MMLGARLRRASWSRLAGGASPRLAVQGRAPSVRPARASGSTEAAPEVALRGRLDRRRGSRRSELHVT